MSLPPVPKNWHWAKGTPAGGLHAWLGQLRGRVTDLESRSGTSGYLVRNVNGAVADAQGRVDIGLPDLAQIDAMQTVLDLFQGGVDSTDLTIAAATSDSSSQTRQALAPLLADQADYVSTLASLSNYDRMTLTRINSAGALAITCHAPNGDTVTHRLTESNRYQYLSTVTALDGSTPKAQFFWPADFTTTGTYNAAGQGLFGFTSQVGATWEATVTVDAPRVLQIRTFTDNRGGVWNITVPGHPSLSRSYSTWRSTGGSVQAPLLTLPAAGTYTIRGTFAGDDPANPPSSGAGTARGWASTTVAALLDTGATGPTEIVLAPPSNKDFAVMIRPAGSSGAYEYVPYHGTETEAPASPARYLDKGRPIDVTAMTVGTPVDIDGFEVIQHIYGRNAAAPGVNLVEFWTRQRIEPDGRVTVVGRWKTLVDVQFNAASYVMMFMVDPTRFNQLVSSRARSYGVQPAGSTQLVWLTDSDTADGYAFLSPAGHVAAVQYANRAETLRVGAPSKPAPESRTFMELRAGGILAKVYSRLYDTGTVVPAGTVHRFSGSYWYGAIPGVRDVLTLG